jgi:hypothetical protein
MPTGRDINGAKSQQAPIIPPDANRRLPVAVREAAGDRRGNDHARQRIMPKAIGRTAIAARIGVLSS